MTDFGKRLIDRFEDAREDAEELSDDLAAQVFSYAERLVKAVTDEPLFRLPDEETANIVESAIRKQAKWSPDEVKPKWSLALNILNDEKVTLSFRR
jgi:hypothetical protein